MSWLDKPGGTWREIVSGGRLTVSAALAAALACPSAGAQCVTSLPAGSIGPKSIVGQGPNGEKAASVDAVKLTDAEAAKVKAGKFKVGISMQTMNLDWSQLQVQGITDTLKKYGVEVIGTASAEYQVDKQIADIENTIQRHPDGIISIPVDGTATAATYKKVSAAGIKLVFMDNVPTGLKHPEQYASMISADSEGNGQIAAKVLASCVPQGAHDRARQFRRRLLQHDGAHEGSQRLDEEEPSGHQDQAGRLHGPVEGRPDCRRLPDRVTRTSRDSSPCGINRRSTR